MCRGEEAKARRAADLLRFSRRPLLPTTAISSDAPPARRNADEQEEGEENEEEGSRGKQKPNQTQINANTRKNAQRRVITYIFMSIKREIRQRASRPMSE